jgi:hypothetical protein
MQLPPRWSTRAARTPAPDHETVLAGKAPRRQIIFVGHHASGGRDDL